MRITCRMCGMKAPAQPDAVLLCEQCREQAWVLQHEAATMRQTACDQQIALLDTVDVPVLQRMGHLLAARRQARGDAAAWAAFLRRYHRTLALDDSFGCVLRRWDALDRIRTAMAQAQQEFAVLADSEETL